MLHIFNPLKPNNKKILLLIISWLGISQALLSQVSITGPTCISPGVDYIYTISGTWNSGTSMNWTLTNGVITGTSNTTASGTPLPNIHVTWLSGYTSGTVALTASTGSASLNVNTAPALQPGSLSTGKNQNINYNTTPGGIFASLASGGACSPSYSYQWQKSTNNVNFTDTVGATSQNLAFSSTYKLTQASYFRRKVTETSSGIIKYSDTATITVYGQLHAGVISPSSQSINYSTYPAVLTVSGTSGGDNSYSYQWQSSIDGNSWANVDEAPSASAFTPMAKYTAYYRVIVTSNNVKDTTASVFINITPQLIPGTLSPATLNILSSTSPGILSATPASGGNCSGSYTYQWQVSTNGTSFTDISGATGLTYTPGNLTATTYYRRTTTCGTESSYTNTAKVTVGLGNSNLNFIRIRDITKQGVPDETTAYALTAPLDAKQNTQYFDGLGRLIQTVNKQSSPQGKDQVVMTVYDDFNKETVKYLPYTSSSNDGNYKPYALQEQIGFNTIQFPNEDGRYYSQTGYEPSPLNRVKTEMAAGMSWVGSNRGISNQYLVNKPEDSVRIWNISAAIGSIPTTTVSYDSGQLYKSIIIDEQNHQIVEYKDKEGKVVLKKVQLASTPGTAYSGWLCTYYVYDVLNNLRFVIQPKAVDTLVKAGTWNLSSITNLVNELCFRYEYDGRKRMIIKDVPGASEVWIVYDARDRVVMTQDSLQRANTKWIVNEYDSLNRIVKTFLLNDNHDRAYHQNLAVNSISYPTTTGAELVKQLYYDNYDWVFSPLPATMDASNVSNSSYFYTTYNASPVYAQNPVSGNYWAKGMLTGQKVEVLNTNGAQNLSSVFFYDDHGRQIQRQSTNNVSGKDVSTTQYDFSGKVLRNLLNHNKTAGSFQTRTVLTKNTYDAMGRIISIVKKIDNVPDQTIATYSYNELGQLQNKQLGNNIENLTYAYNIRGWLNTINKDYVSGNSSGNYFGMELGYDKSASVAAGGNYPTQNLQFNGNIAGTIWKTAGDGVARKYDFTYDNMSRLTGADFKQQAGLVFDRSANIDFSVSNLSYDANGNITRMDQKGYRAGTSPFIDQLTYAYQSAGNKLLQVTDGANDDTSRLGDFHYKTSTKLSTDYTYDGNGNLITDNNKNITSILYHLYNGTPRQVKMKGKGTITYQYDADGNKLLETTVDSTTNPVKTFVKVYVEGFVYEGIQFATDTFTYVSHEEGRARWAYHKYLNGTTKYGFEYDYFVKDHLGNTRVILTQQKDTARYLASMEGAYRATENQLFNNIGTTAFARSLVPSPGYPNDTTFTNPNDSVSRLNGNGPRVGPSLLLKVMSGDAIDVLVQSYYNSVSATDTNSSFNDVLNSLANGIVGASGGAKGAAADLTNSSTGPLFGALTNFLANNDPKPVSYPKAYLNWILLDEQLRYVSSYPQSGSIPAAGASRSAGQLNILSYSGIPVTKSGYLYIWVSNETKGWDVFFDNLRVNHYAGPLLEETHYYPFGLTMAAISDQALKPLYYENKNKFNKGSELQNKEFSDGTGLELYATPLRSLDPQLGRWWQIDSKPNDAESPYASMANNPILNNDPLGDTLSPQARALFLNPPKNKNGDQTGLIRNATSREYQENPLKAAGKDILHLALSFAGLNDVDDQSASLRQKMDNGSVATGDVVEAVAGVGMATTKGEGKTPAVLGKEGMAAAGIEQNKTQIPSLTGTADYRVPDGLTKTTLTEVKNVAKLSYTNQLKDYVQHSEKNNLNFNLHVRETTQLSKPLQEAIKQGKIKLFVFGD